MSNDDTITFHKYKRNEMKFKRNLVSYRLALFNLLSRVLIAPYSTRTLRAVVLRMGGVRIAVGSQLCGHVFITGRNVSIGSGSFVGPWTMLESNDDARISIGCNVSIG